jgi:exonuclease SbcD
VLQNLADFIERQRVDLLLMSGDVFDSGAPIAEAEKIVFGFFKRVGRAGTQTVVIAGNHDQPARLAAWGTLAELVDVHAVALPRRAREGGVVRIEAGSGETAVVAAVPFAAPRLLVSALELAGSETGSRQTYAESLREIVAEVSSAFTADTVNLLMAHTHLEGAVLSGSERQVHLGEQWAGMPQALPSTAHYIALGHIHRPQRVEAAPSPAYYAGSPLQLDFGEAGERKVFLLVEAKPRQPARIEPIPYQGGKPLVSLRAPLAELERESITLRDAGWLRVRVPLGAPDPDLNGKVRRLLPNAVVVEAEIGRVKKQIAESRPPAGASPVELFRAYFLREHARQPEPDLLEAFERLAAAAEAD